MTAGRLTCPVVSAAAVNKQDWTGIRLSNLKATPPAGDQVLRHLKHNVVLTD